MNCVHCGLPIHQPPVGSYPPEVQWVHDHNAMGYGNRYCSPRSGTTARPAEEKQ